MTNLEFIKNMSVDELTAWLDDHNSFDTAPWTMWFDKKYCKNCPAEIIYIEAIDKEAECNWCELNYKCKYFEELEEAPSMKEIIKMWLQEEVKEDGIG